MLLKIYNRLSCWISNHYPKTLIFLPLKISFCNKVVGDLDNKYVTGSSSTGDKSPDDASRSVEGGVLSLAGKQYYLSWRNGRMKFGETEEESKAMMNWEIGEISVTKLEFIAAYDSLYLIHTYKYFYVYG